MPELSQLIEPPLALIAKSKPLYTTTNQQNYHPLPPHNTPSNLTSITGKHKHTKSKDPHLICYFEGSNGEDDASKSGDGLSSGDNITSDAPTSSKHQRMSRMKTRSLTQTPVSNPVSDGALNHPSPAPAPCTLPLAAIATAMNTPVASPPANLTTVATPTSLIDAQSNTAQPNMMDDEPSPPDAPAEPLLDEVTTDTEADITSTRVSSNVTVTGVKTIPQDNVVMPTTPPSLVSLTVIDRSKVPAFLLSHSKGACWVNIFAYLNEIQDPHFRQLLFHYIQFKAHSKPNLSRTLSTTGRPAEIGQWTGQAHPLALPDYTKGEKMFQMFTGSILKWWDSLQPTWRTFNCNKVSREVSGGWEDLCSPRINGLLNVVILTYWWIRILDELKPEGSVHMDYESFAEDVSWVFSKLLI